MGALDDILTVVGWAGAACGLVLAFYWSVGLWRMAATRRTLPTARAGLALAAARTAPWPSVAIVIPAHNEARVIAELIASLRAIDYPRLRITLALDRCTDGTPALARAAVGDDPRFTIEEIEECEAGWAGKVHAVYRGVHAGPDGGALNADLLLFADADTLFHPGCVKACVSLLEARGLQMLSLVSTMRYEKWFELTAQPMAGLELIRQYPLLASNSGPDRRAFANGQFMLFTRDCYVRFGGHHEVRKHLLEDLRFADILKYYFMPQGVLLADGMLICRMYDTWEQFRKGWKRIFTEAAHRKPTRLAALGLRVRLSQCLLPAGALAALVVGLTTARPPMAAPGAAGLILWLTALVAMQKMARGPWWCALTAWLGAWLVGGLLLEAGRDVKRGKPTEWGGMSYVRRPKAE